MTPTALAWLEGAANVAVTIPGLYAYVLFFRHRLTLERARRADDAVRRKTLEILANLDSALKTYLPWPMFLMLGAGLFAKAFLLFRGFL